MTAYQEVRAAGKSMHEKVVNSSRDHGFHPGRIAKRLGIPTPGRTIIVDSEVAQNALIDFWFYEYRVDGKTLVQRADPAAAGLTPVEQEVLAACRQSYASFFKIEDVMPNEHQLRCRDLLEPERPPVVVTDIHMSQSFGFRYQPWCLFCRLITLRDITMTSGFAFGFQPELAPGLVEGCRQKMKRVKPEDLGEERFIFFFRKHRLLGEAQAYQDVV